MVHQAYTNLQAKLTQIGMDTANMQKYNAPKAYQNHNRQYKIHTLKTYQQLINNTTQIHKAAETLDHLLRANKRKRENQTLDSITKPHKRIAKHPTVTCNWRTKQLIQTHTRTITINTAH